MMSEYLPEELLYLTTLNSYDRVGTPFLPLRRAVNRPDPPSGAMVVGAAVSVDLQIAAALEYVEPLVLPLVLKYT
jgi:hypothetical protein